MNNYYLLIKKLPFYCLLGIALNASGQGNGSVIKITYPESRAIFQRDVNNTSTIYLSGSYYQPIDSVQARVQVEDTYQGFSTNWATIQRNPQGSVFQGALSVKGGWYRLEVRAFANGAVVGSDVMRKIGVGEVFIITGQSNAQGFQDFGAVGATDDRVNCVTYDNSRANLLTDPPAPTFQQLSAASLIGPRGQSAWCWGMLGDLIAKQYQVPVLFINTAWQGTVIKNWTESADGKIAKNIFAMGTPNENFPAGMPYANLLIALRYYCSLQGLRAVLWQQGENDNVPLRSTRQDYREAMQYLVNKTRSDTKRYPAWVLARSSYNLGQVSEEITQAQNDVINTYNNNVYPGPLTDNIQIPRFEGEVHFGGDGLKQLAQAWYESLNPVFFASSRPLLPLPPPTISVTCGPDNNSLTLTLSEGYKSYDWKSGQKTRSINVNRSGVYRAVLKGADDNTFLSPAVEVIDPVQPTPPTISLAKQPTLLADPTQQICTDSVLALVGNTTASNSLIWNTGTVGRTITVATPGGYSVQAVNTYGCRSTRSLGINLTVRPKIPTPSIEQIGTYSLEARLPAPSGAQTDEFDWRRTGELIPESGPVAKVVLDANYSVRAKSTFILENGNRLTCYSDFSAPKPFDFDESNGGLGIYPNPSKDGIVNIETIENLANAEIEVFSLHGELLYTDLVPILNQRRSLNLKNLAQGEYIVRIRSAGFNVSRRIIINR